MTLDEIIANAAQRWNFRKRDHIETADDYRAALIGHVATFDFASAHEIRVGRVQAEWTDDEIADFRDRMLAMRSPPTRFAGHKSHVVAVIPSGQIGRAADDNALLRLARTTLDSYASQRTRDPRATLPISIVTLMLDGEFGLTVVDRGERVATARMLVETLPVFGVVVVADAYVHAVPPPGVKGSAQKWDAIVVHARSRSSSVLITRRYRPTGRACACSRSTRSSSAPTGAGSGQMRKFEWRARSRT